MKNKENVESKQIYCGYCGRKKEHKVETDINTPLICPYVFCSKPTTPNTSNNVEKLKTNDYRIIISEFIGQSDTGSCTYKLTFNKSLGSTDSFKDIENGLNLTTPNTSNNVELVFKQIIKDLSYGEDYKNEYVNGSKDYAKKILRIINKPLWLKICKMSNNDIAHKIIDLSNNHKTNTTSNIEEKETKE